MKPSYAELVEALEELVGSVPPRHSYSHEEERFEAAQDKAKEILDRVSPPGGPTKVGA